MTISKKNKRPNNYIFWGDPLPSNSDHQNNDILDREPLYKTSTDTIIWKGDDPKIYQIHLNLRVTISNSVLQREDALALACQSPEGLRVVS